MRSMDYIFVAVTVFIVSVTAEDKLAKHFSLFSVVTFGNEECTSDTSVAGGATQGTCYSSTECSDKNGMSSGNCASGFGVCCVFLNTGVAASTITENRTRLRNYEYPSIATATTAVSVAYTINKMKSDICQIRLDFGTFVIAGPSLTTENIPATASTLCQDSLTLLTSDNTAVTSSPFGTLCGSLTGQHLYVDLSPTAADALTATLTTLVDGTLTAAIAKRVWDIKVSQIECHATFRAPPGCQRYFMEPHDKITSMNFNKVAGSTKAANAQNTGVDIQTSHIRSCIRRAKGMCCVQYDVCTTYNGEALVDFNNGITANNNGASGIYNEGFSFDMNISPNFVIHASQVNSGLVDSQCTGDYVEIPSSMSRSCGSMFGSYLSAVNTRYCGARLGAAFQYASTQTGSSSVCDCSEPFSMTIHLDDVSDNGAVATANVDVGTANVSKPRGTCLEYKQTPCYS